MPAPARIPDELVPEAVRQLCERLRGAGHRAWIVGGCVRDLLMGKAIHDWDLATTARPAEVQRLFRRTIPTGIQHGTVTVMIDKVGYEVTTLRGEGAYSDGRRPDAVHFVGDIEDDLARRDFTVNAIAFDPLTGELADPWGGLADLAQRRIRAVRDPRERFQEDGLRVLRAARFCASLEFDLDPDTEAAIAPSLDTFRKVSAERVHDEWRKALETARPSRAFVVMRRTGMLAITCPPLAALDDAAWDRTTARVDAAPREPWVRTAALLLDLHAADARLDEWLRGMRASNPERKRVLHLAAHGRPPSEGALDAPALRRWLRAVGRDALDDVLALARADGRDVDGLEARARAELERGLPLELRELPIGGDDVLAVLGRPPGRYVGQILERALARVHEDPSCNDRERLLALVPELDRELSGA